MGKFLSKFLLVIIVIVLAVVVGMISPGQKMTNLRHEINKFYNKIRFSKTPIAQGFLSSPFSLKMVYVENTEGQLEVYLINTEKDEMLPILEVEGTTQVGNVKHRLKGIGEEGRNKLKDILESAREGGTGAIDKALQLLGE